MGVVNKAKQSSQPWPAQHPGSTCVCCNTRHMCGRHQRHELMQTKRSKKQSKASKRETSTGTQTGTKQSIITQPRQRPRQVFISAIPAEQLVARHVGGRHVRHQIVVHGAKPSRQGPRHRGTPQALHIQPSATRQVLLACDMTSVYTYSKVLHGRSCWLVT
jgi:hypothetical protein